MIGKILTDRWGWTGFSIKKITTVSLKPQIKDLKIIDKTGDYQKINGTYTLCSDKNEIILTPQQWNMYRILLKK